LLEATALDAAHTFVRRTAQIAFALYLSTFVAAALRHHWPSAASRWLLANRRYLGVSFASVMLLHLGGITSLVLLEPLFSEERGVFTVAAGGVGYAFLFAMAATSFDGAVKRLGPAAWGRLHRLGTYYVWIVFLASYGPRAIVSAAYVPAALLLVLALGLRLAPRH
jgi:DMSO/TMAO reductase YedYZ heme-binding membrane subunit